MDSPQRDPARLSRRGVLAATAGMTVGTGIGLAAPAVAGQRAGKDVSDQDFSTMAVSVNFTQWGTIYLAPGAVQTWWFTWYFDGNRWSRMSAVPLPESPAGSSVEIVAEWATVGTLNVTFRNNGTAGVLFKPTVIVAPQ